MPGSLTTHVLDTAHGIPGAGIPITLLRVADGAQLASTATNDDGRTDVPLLEGDGFEAGTYELRFDVEAYFAGRIVSGDAPFLSTVVVRFAVSRPDEHYHVPLLVSPFGYTTYRGS